MSAKTGQLRILIAHQSTIPPYRVPFFEALEQRKPGGWHIDVVNAPRVSLWRQFEAVQPDEVAFNIRPTRSMPIPFTRRKGIFQTFILGVFNYDIIIVENALNNVSYPIACLSHWLGRKVILWGHGRDRGVIDPTGIKKVMEHFKLWLARNMDGFLAYTESVRDFLLSRGVSDGKITCLYNTIDISAHRREYEKLRGQRDQLRSQAGLKGKKVLLYVGRLSRRKRLDLLAGSFKILARQDPDYQLLVVGDGDADLIDNLRNECGPDRVDYRGSITDPEDLAPLYIMSDLFVLPGAVGLAPIQALAYNLPVVVIDSATHGPEFEYISAENALILPPGASADAYATAIHQFLTNEAEIGRLRQGAWASISHLTVEAMADHFISGIQKVAPATD